MAGQVGRTEGVGWNIGVSRTVSHPLAEVWELLVSKEGLRLWLGDVGDWSPAKGERYETATGITGEVRSRHEQNRLRLTWRPSDWSHDTTVQVAVTPSDERTLLRFHQEWLASPEERASQRDYWRAALDQVLNTLENRTQSAS